MKNDLKKYQPDLDQGSEKGWENDLSYLLIEINLFLVKYELLHYPPLTIAIWFIFVHK
jgi:hypothetical protein